jgi:hypothetical protein
VEKEVGFSKPTVNLTVINVTSIAFIIANCIGSAFMAFAIKASSSKGCKAR